jgi:hypothetical protein
MNNEKMTLTDAKNKVIKFCSATTTLPTLLGTLHRVMDLHDWRTLLGDVWTNCDNVGAYRDELKRAMFPTGQPHTRPEMMTQREREALAALPELVTVYRGCGPENVIGCCWSLDRETATISPTLVGYRQESPRLVTATVRRDRIVALKLTRNEKEVITFDACHVSVETLIPGG